MAGQRQWPSGPSPWGRAGIPSGESSGEGIVGDAGNGEIGQE